MHHGKIKFQMASPALHSNNNNVLSCSEKVIRDEYCVFFQVFTRKKTVIWEVIFHADKVTFHLYIIEHKTPTTGEDFFRSL